ncbi:MAG: AAA family ATPase [bacterium]|nr:AAA family ATPase [bacterium]
MDGFLAVFPERIRKALQNCLEDSAQEETPLKLDDLVEIIADLGRRAQARFYQRSVYLGDQLVTAEEIQYVVERLSGIGKDNRAGIEATLHRISVIRSRQGRVIGLTCRVGRAVYGSADVLRDVFTEGKSVLLLGSPGVGKTTLLREIARVLADDYHKRVVIVDTSNEIAGDGDIPHPGIGGARRMPVPEPALQHSVMIEAVENHMPEVVVIDEIGNEAETYAARTIAERGVMLVATAHGLKLENLLQNPTLSDLVGGIQSVTLSDEEAKRRKSRKSVLERKAPPTFGVIVEVRERNLFAVHRDVAQVVDNSLRGVVCEPEMRCRRDDGSVKVTHPAFAGEGCRSAQSGPWAAGTAADEVNGGANDAGSDSGDLLEEMRAAGWLSDDAEGDGDTVLPSRRERRDIYRDETSEDGYRLAPPPPDEPDVQQTVRIYPYAVSRNRLQGLIDTLGVDAKLVGEWHDSDLVLTVRGIGKRKDPFFAAIRNRSLPIHYIRGNTGVQMQSFLESFFHVHSLSASDIAKRELDKGILSVKRTGRPVDLSPQEFKLRRLQSKVAEAAGVTARSYGNEPFRYVRLSLE